MENKVKEMQDYLHSKGIDVSETAIVNVAIECLTRWGGNRILAPEFWETKKR